MSADLILSALYGSPVLIGDYPEAVSFDRSLLSLPEQVSHIFLDQKLGHIYEDGFAELIERSDHYELLEKGLQIQSDCHRTLGELDFLIRDLTNGELIHLELAVKFYLAVKSSDDLFLPGPDARDNYFKKLQHLRSHQTTITQRFRCHLPQPYREEDIKPKQLILGCLFDHINAQELAEPEYISSSVRRGKWLRQSEFYQHYSENELVAIIPKYLWPVAVNDLDGVSLERLDLGQRIERCVLVQIQGEQLPVFIAPNDYPQ